MFIKVIVFFKEGGASHALFDTEKRKFIRLDHSELEYTVCDCMEI